MSWPVIELDNIPDGYELWDRQEDIPPHETIYLYNHNNKGWFITTRNLLDKTTISIDCLIIAVPYKLKTTTEILQDLKDILNSSISQYISIDVGLKCLRNMCLTYINQELRKIKESNND